MELTALYSLLIITLIIYLVGYFYEAVLSIKRLSNKKREIYPHIFWEITHTTLIIVFTVFMITHGPMLPEIAKIIFIPLFIVMIGFFIRGIFLLIIFYSREKSTDHSIVDVLFALSHALILIPFVYSIGLVVIYLMTHEITVLTSSLGWFIPGLILAFIINVGPLIYLVRLNNRAHVT